MINDYLAIRKISVHEAAGLSEGFYAELPGRISLESKNPQDSLMYVKYSALIWVAILKFRHQASFKRGPIGIIRGLVGYPWILIFSGLTA